VASARARLHRSVVLHGGHRRRRLSSRSGRCRPP
jgi:hypothetical protein